MYLDTKEYVEILRELTEEGREVRLQIAGNSMYPFLRDRRDTVFFARPRTPLKPGDVVFYQRAGGQFVLHRICRIHGRMLYLAGDAQTELEGPVPEKAVFARVTHVLRKGKDLRPGTAYWSFYSCFWRRCRPVRRQLLSLYSLLKSAFSGTPKRRTP